jgi:hypothetical protein
VIPRFSELHNQTTDACFGKIGIAIVSLEAYIRTCTTRYMQAQVHRQLLSQLLDPRVVTAGEIVGHYWLDIEGDR